MQSVDDEVAAANTLLFPEWEPDMNLTAGQKVRYNGVLYKVLQAHIAQGGWSPEDAPSLFAKLLIPDEDVIPEWEQPDSTNPYMKGDRVIHRFVYDICEFCCKRDTQVIHILPTETSG